MSNTLESSEIMRILLTYGISIFICISLMIGNYDSSYKSSIMKIIVISFIFFAVCGIFDYLWVNYYLIDNRDTNDTDNRDTIHTVLHIIIPGIILVLGYTFLISGFKSKFSTSNAKTLSLFITKFLALASVIVAYIYYTMKLMNILYKKNSTSTDNNTQVDILYSILHKKYLYILINVYLNID